MLPTIIDEFTEKAPYLNANNIVNFNMGIKPSTGERFIQVKTTEGKIYIKTISPNGIVDTRVIEIPDFYSKSERDELIVYLRTEKKLLQSDIAIYLGVSQSLVSNVLRKRNIK